MKKTLIHIHHTIWITFIFFLMLAALLITAARLATPWLAKQKPLVEQWTSTLLDQPVKIQQFTINWEGFEPVLRCNNVTIFDDKKTQPLLRVHELDIGISIIRSVLSGSFRIGHLRINGLHLTLSEDQNGQFNIRGINTPLNSSTNNQRDNNTLNEIITWLFAEPEITLQDVIVTWYDKDNKVVPIQGLNFTIKNKGLSHNLSGQATLAQIVPSQIAFTIKIKGDWQDRPNLKAAVYLNARNIVLPQWIDRLNISHLTIKKGLANFELWGKWQKDHWQSWQSLFSLENIAFTYTRPVKDNVAQTSQAKTLPTINLKHLSGNISWQPVAGGGWQITGNQLIIAFADEPWEANQFSVTVNADFSQQNWQLAYINLTQLTPFLLKTRLLPEEWQVALQQLHPQGILRNTQLHYQIAQANIPAQFIVQTQFEQLDFNRWQSIPGVKHLSGQLQLSQNAGNLHLNSQHVQMNFGKLFKAPLNFSTLQAQVNWLQTEKGWDIKANQLVIKNPDINTTMQAHLFLAADNQNPYLSLLASYNFLDAQHIANYLPLTELSPALVQWLSNALLRFAKADGTLIINGHLKDFPFEKNNGTFMVDSHIKDADLAYWPKWPQLKHFSAELLFEGSSLQALVNSGQIFSSQVKHLVATIPSLHKGATLSIQGQLTGDLNDALRFLRESPLHDSLKNGIDNLAAQGPLQLQLGLTIPFEHEPIKVQGQINTQAATLSLPKWNLEFPHFQGQLNFTEAGLNANNLTATLWQKPVTINITTTKQQGMQIQLAGQVAIKDLQKQFNTNLLNSINGNAPYTVTLNVARKDGPDDLHIQSNLKGIAINLPAPLAKTADQIKNFELVTGLNGVQAFNKFTINYGDLVTKVNKRTDNWTLNLQSPMAQGTIMLPTEKGATLQANFQHLYLTADATDNSANKPLQPQDIPNLYFTCQDFRYDDKNFGRVTINLKSIPNGIAINQLQAISPAFKLTANGNWRRTNNQLTTTLSGNLSSENMATALASWGLPSAGFSTKNSQVGFALQWPGAPYDPNLANLRGSISLNFKEGQMSEVGADSKVKMNIGRVLTIMSWQSIARRLQLDFSDLTQHGYSFNILQGDFVLANGDAITKNTYLDGPMAKVTVSGRIGLTAQDFDMHLGVTTHLSSSLTLLAGIAGGPVVGIATGAASWLANKMFSNEMGKLAMDNYHLTGPWSDPQVIAVKKQL